MFHHENQRPEKICNQELKNMICRNEPPHRLTWFDELEAIPGSQYFSGDSVFQSIANEPGLADQRRAIHWQYTNWEGAEIANLCLRGKSSGMKGRIPESSLLCSLKKLNTGDDAEVARLIMPLDNCGLTTHADTRSNAMVHGHSYQPPIHGSYSLGPK